MWWNWTGVNMTLHTPALLCYHWITFQTAARLVPAKLGIEADSFDLLELFAFGLASKSEPKILAFGVVILRRCLDVEGAQRPR